MRIVANFDPSQQTASTFNAGFSNGTGRIVVYNESNINLALSWGSFSTYCPAWTAMLYCIQSNNVNINWTQQSQLAANGSPISQVIVEAYDSSEAVLGTYPAALVRQTNIGNSVAVSSSASAIANDGNVAGTQIAEATVSGDVASAVSLLNTGILALGNATHHGSISSDNQLFKTDGSGNLTLVNLIASLVNVNPAKVTINGGANGHCDHYMPLQGTIKMVLIHESFFRTGASNQDYTLPTPFTYGGLFFAGDVCTFTFLSSGSGQNVDVITSLATGGGSAVNTGSAAANSIGGITHPFDTIRHNANAGSNHNSWLFVIGI